MTIPRQPGTPTTKELEQMSSGQLFLKAQDMCVERDELIATLKAVLPALVAGGFDAHVARVRAVIGVKYENQNC